MFFEWEGGGSFDTEMNERKNHSVMPRQLGNVSNLKPLFIILWHDEEFHTGDLYREQLRINPDDKFHSA